METPGRDGFRPDADGKPDGISGDAGQKWQMTVGARQFLFPQGNAGFRYAILKRRKARPG